MLKAVWIADPAEFAVSLRLSGHAGAGPRGTDPVCAAVSILAYAMAKTLEDAAAEGLLCEPPTVRLEPGDGFLSARAKDGAAYAALLDWTRAVRNGLLLIRNAEFGIRN